jgi:hypothetical protein
VARPEVIARLHEAKFELRIRAGSKKDTLLERYRSILQEAADLYQTTGAQIEAAVASDFGDWVRQERLPKMPPNSLDS